MTRRGIAALALACCCLEPLCGERLPLRNYTTEHGLASNALFAFPPEIRKNHLHYECSGASAYELTVKVN